MAGPRRQLTRQWLFAYPGQCQYRSLTRRYRLTSEFAPHSTKCLINCVTEMRN